MFLKLAGKVKDILPKSKFSKNVIKIISGTGLGHLVSLFFYPILTRLYDPAEFGTLAVFVSFLSIISVIASLRYEFAIPLAPNNRNAINVLFLSLCVLFIITTIIGITLSSTGGYITTLIGVENLYPYLWAVPIGVMFFGLFQNLNFWAVRVQQFKVLSIAKFFQALGVVLTQLALFSIGAGGLIIGHITGYATASIILFLLLRNQLKSLKRHFQITKLFELAKRYAKFPLISSFSGLINSLGLYIPAILLTTFYSVEVAGFFTLTQRVISAPLTLIGKSIAQVYYSEVTNGLKTNPSEVRRLFKNTVGKLFLFSVIPITLFCITAPFLFATIFGEEWRETGVYISYLAPLIVMQFVVNPISQTLLILEKQFLQLIWDVCRLILVFSTFFFLQNSDPTYTIFVYGISMSIAYLLMLCISYWQLSVKIKEGG
ncbi:MAG: oligosaccharide flippase family protein [Cyclobacteriaceae bacterium]